ncbi:MAG: YbjQ family protein [Armatimonadetes bacterium]|nr:YbjQ family protein [Armatimonadota bacterium]
MSQAPPYVRPPDVHQYVTTANHFDGYKVAQYLGVVRGLTVRSRSAIGNFAASFQTMVGGNITIYTELAEKARQEAYQLMVQHAAAMGANGIIAMRYDANDIMPGVTEVLAYGTAVVLEPA